MEFYLVRHGRAEDAVAGLVQRPATRLTPRGRKQARAAGAELRRRLRRAPRVWASDYPRAAETARIVSRAIGARVTLLADLREIGLGPWTGRPVAALLSGEAKALARWTRDARRAVRPGMEPVGKVLARARRALAHIARTGPGPHVVVSHGGVISILLEDALGIAPRTAVRFPVWNGSISRVIYEGRKKFLSAYNETGHLAR